MTNLEERNIEHAILMKELEWGVNTETNTVYMAYDFDMDNLYTIVTKIDNLLRHQKDPRRALKLCDSVESPFFIASRHSSIAPLASIFLKRQEFNSSSLVLFIVNSTL